MSEAIKSRLVAAREWCVAAGKSTLELFQNKELAVDKKSDRSPVTEADRNAEQILRNLISKEFPEDGIVGEEFGETPGMNSFRWILDPIDGTKSFISGVPLYGTMVGVEFEGEPTIGVIYFPGLDEGAFAATGDGAWHFVGQQTPTRCQTSHCQALDEAVLVTSEIETFAERQADDAYQRLRKAVYFVRTWGDCYGYLLVATGRVDIMIDPILNIWDAAAVAPIIREAGGDFVDWQGKPRIDAGEAIGCAAGLTEAILHCLQSDSDVAKRL